MHPIRAFSMLLIVIGLVLLVAFGTELYAGIREQQQLNQAWQGEMSERHFSGPPVIDPSLQRPFNGVDFAIRVPKLGYYAAVKEGIDSATLYSSPGRYPQTVWPGDQGTVGVAAHNVYWINFPKLVPGDEIDIETRYGTYRYHVTGSRIVGPNDRTVLVPDGPGYHLTLTTCWPLWAGAFATQRYVIFTDQFDPIPPRQMFN